MEKCVCLAGGRLYLLYHAVVQQRRSIGNHAGTALSSLANKRNEAGEVTLK